ncbi:frequenin-1-like [Watersipora subatra]|uniref:frequenin-1-like n=1 Tax=Watersipora subatra TaxID=2589382 RepID=UPI00355B38BD
MGNHNSNSLKHMKDKEIHELASHTYFTDEEVRKWHHHFFKDCPNGRLKKETFQAIYRHVFPQGDPTKFAGFVFNVFDKDLDGTIRFDEFLMALSITARGNVDEKLDWAFSLYDIDRDGHISRGEMVQIVSAIYEMIGPDPAVAGITAEAKANQIFDNMDFNKDGLLTIDEFRGGAKKDPWIVHALTMDPTSKPGYRT